VRRSFLVLGIGALVAFVVAGVVFNAGPPPADSSVLSRGSSGWMAARMYLEARGGAVRLLDRPLEKEAPHGVLVLAFPFQVFDNWQEGIDRHLQNGGTLVFAYSGKTMQGPEEVLGDGLGLSFQELRRHPPLTPWLWRSWASEEWPLLPVPEAFPRAQEGSFLAPRNLPKAPPGARILFRTKGNRPAAFAFPRFRGRILVFPADALSNGRLANAGNAALLEALLSLGARFSFDEYHHGLQAPLDPSDARPVEVMDMSLVHLGFVYLVVVLALASRFGPAWREPPAISGGVGVFLKGLGHLHHRLGHHAEAAELLVARAQELDPRLELRGDRPGSPLAGAELVALAGRVARSQRGGMP
jgi:hypothetical protein